MKKGTKIKYQPPELIPLGELATGVGDNCQSGNFPGSEDDCQSGSGAGRDCQNGGIPGQNCQTGGVAQGGGSCGSGTSG